MIINGSFLKALAPIVNMVTSKLRKFGVSYGMSEVGVDIRVKQTIRYCPPDPQRMMELFLYAPDVTDPSMFDVLRRCFFGYTEVEHDNGHIEVSYGRHALASSVEEFQIPTKLWCEFRNKSTHARRFIDATIGTDGEPGWKGFLTIEIIFHGVEPIIIPAGSGILKAVFHEVKEEVAYEGKYQNQADEPVFAKLDGEDE